MGRIGNIARRTFLIGSAAVAGGVAFGTYAYKKPTDNPLLDHLGDGENAITPYVRIDAEGITLITPRADFGQGGYSTQAMLIAEELDVDPNTVRLDPGPPSAAYYNGAVMEEASPFPAYNTDPIAERARSFMHVPAKLLGLQITGGSSTVPDTFVKLRSAGCVARETLKQAAAQMAGVERSALKTQNGQVILPDGKTLGYVELAPLAATLDPVMDVPLRDESTWKYIRKNTTKRVDMIARCTGTFDYGIDLAFDDMVYASVRANPGIGGGVKSYDANAAQSMRGVQKIVPITSGVGVIADNTWRAMQAVNAIDITWDAPDYPASSDEIWQVLENAISDEYQDTRNRDDGDVETALADGDVLEAQYRIPFLAHAPLEPMNAIVKVSDDKCEIWTGTQIPGFVKDHAAKMTGLDADQVFVYTQPMGGSFGRRLEDTYVLQTIELAMAVKGTPVKMTWSREEDFAHDYPRCAQVSRARGKVANGQVDSLDLSIAAPSTAASWFGRIAMAPPGPDASLVAGAWDQPFAIPNYRVTGYRAPETVPVSSWRSVGASGNGFLHDCFLDELIHRAGADPLMERFRLCHHDVSRKVLETVGEMCNWNGHAIGENRGRGVAFTMAFSVPCAQVIEVTNTPDGIKIDNVWVAADVGKVVEPINLEAQIFGGVIFGLGHAMNCELTYDNHVPDQTNYHNYEGMRLYQCPQIMVKALENGAKIRGIGEPGVPPAAPALANAIFAATGQRIREMPLNKHINFV
ncbi:isoquinoline 1-oxidoreductase [Amylibacter kogurei]|uniref:Isoquinoline 1-oxidoreductase n=1 Tax=Paramylibacter kogurei TaxID=1889778 RepID=A0A2G5K5E9_9RHOB|nr:molybdopterin cofactor-binding domain-containing protein [Amylibacter kogurei]PIB24110.1 isoquinoline 1-oxidoreductase [Amylibacter kogurei]